LPLSESIFLIGAEDRVDDLKIEHPLELKEVFFGVKEGSEGFFLLEGLLSL